MSQLDPTRRRRRAVIRIAAIVAFASTVPFFVFHVVVGAWDVAFAQGGGLIGAIGAWWAMDRDRLGLSGHLLCATFFLMIGYTAWVTGGIAGPAAIWLSAVGWLAAMVNGSRAGAIWLGAVLCALGGLASQDSDPGRYSAVTIDFAWLSNVLFIAAMAATVGMQNQVVVRLVRQIGKAERAAATANRDKDQFLADMSHQFRTPLTTIVGYTEILSEDAEDEGRERALRDLVRIQLASRSLMPIMDDILDVARQASPAETVLSPGPIDLSSLAAELRAAIEPLATQGDNTFEIEVDRPPAMPVLDEGRLRQVLLNLLGNACKFTRSGRIVLRLEGRPDGELRFEVEDTGIGMDAEQQARVFLPFEQATTTIRDAYGGAGLGLAICKRLTEAMGGQLQVESSLGRGTRFFGRLPGRRAA